MKIEVTNHCQVTVEIGSESVYTPNGGCVTFVASDEEVTFRFNRYNDDDIYVKMERDDALKLARAVVKALEFDGD